MTRNHISAEEGAQIIKDYNGGQGLTVTQLAKRSNRQNCTIVRFLRKAGVFVKKATWDKSSSKLTPEIVDKIGEAYKAGESQDALGLRFGISATLVRKALARAGVESRESWQPADSTRFDDTHARCSACGEKKLRGDFHVASGGKPMHVCKECYRWQHRLREYGITKEQYGAMFLAQGGACLCCGEKWAGSLKHPDLVVDHDHTTGKIRGLLCPECNKAAGHIKDSPETARRMAAYLEQHTVAQASPIP